MPVLIRKLVGASSSVVILFAKTFLRIAYENLLDVDNLIDYMLIIFWGGNLDAPISAFGGNRNPNNYHSLYRRTNGDGFKFFVWDAEHTMLNLNENRTGPFTTGTQLGSSSPQWLWQPLSSRDSPCYAPPTMALAPPLTTKAARADEWTTTLPAITNSRASCRANVRLVRQIQADGGKIGPPRKLS